MAVRFKRWLMTGGAAAAASLAVLGAAHCQTRHPTHGDRTPSDSFEVEDKRALLTSLQQRARRGDRHALRLSVDLYELISPDTPELAQWLKYAAETGGAYEMTAYGEHLYWHGACAEARAWATKAAAIPAHSKMEVWDQQGALRLTEKIRDDRERRCNGSKH